jgi:CheY-like chemotaxis protein
MSLNSQVTNSSTGVGDQTSGRRSVPDSPVVLLVNDQDDTLQMKQVLELSGYRVIDTDNGRDAAKRARCLCPDLVLVDLEVPLLYELVAARQIMKQAFLGALPVVIVTHEEELDTHSMMEVCIRRNEYVTRLSDYEQLGHLLDYLLPIGPKAAVALTDSTGVEILVRSAMQTRGVH